MIPLYPVVIGLATAELRFESYPAPRIGRFANRSVEFPRAR